MRIAIVSSDGENVDLHLGKGSSVYIYDYEKELKFVVPLFLPLVSALP